MARPPLVRINEFLPRPAEVDWDGDGTADANDEWIELFGFTDGLVDLVGWMLDDRADGGTSPYTMPPGTILESGGFLVFHRSTTGIALNDDGDVVRLLSPDGAEMDLCAFPAPKRDSSFSRTADGFGEWTTGYPPSPGEPNRPASPTPTPAQTFTPVVSTTATGTVRPSATPTPPYRPPDPAEIRLNEFLPNSSDKDWNGDGDANAYDEWIELVNLADCPVDLTGWQLDDATGGTAPYRFPAGTILQAHSFGLYSRTVTGVALNNDADTVRLLDPSGAMVDGYNYVEAGQNVSYSRTIDGGGTWTQSYPPSPGGPNLPPTPTPAPTPFSMDIMLNEFLPSPKSIDWDRNGTADFQDEWIELYNPTDVFVNLEGWGISDSAKTYRLPAGTTIWPYGYVVIFRSQSGIALNNDGDRIALLHPGGGLVDEFFYYRNPGSDRSYCRYINGAGPWTTSCYLTPGEVNLPLPVVTAMPTPACTATSDDLVAPLWLTVAGARSSAPGDASGDLGSCDLSRRIVRE